MRQKTNLIFLGALIVLAVNLSCSIQQTKSDPVILEIVTNASGVVYPQGDILDLRLYESGRFEYDDYNNQGKREKQIREAELSAEQVRELIGLAQRADFLSAKEKYPSLRPHIDDLWVTTIKFEHQGQKKRIVVVNFWDILDYPEDRDKYPLSMVKLLERARELRKEGAGKELSSAFQQQRRLTTHSTGAE